MENNFEKIFLYVLLNTFANIENIRNNKNLESVIGTDEILIKKYRDDEIKIVQSIYFTFWYLFLFNLYFCQNKA